MERWPGPVRTAALVVVLAVLATGTVPGVPTVGGTPPALGAGNATVTDVAFTGDPVIRSGRFGTGVFYVTAPRAVVSVADVRDTPRLVYRVTVPALDVTLRDERLLTGTGPARYRLGTASQGVPRSAVTAPFYRVRLTVAVQSFGGHRIVANRTHRVRVGG